jgi:hypothetical protein
MAEAFKQSAAVRSQRANVNVHAQQRAAGPTAATPPARYAIPSSFSRCIRLAPAGSGNSWRNTVGVALAHCVSVRSQESAVPTGTQSTGGETGLLGTANALHRQVVFSHPLFITTRELN